MTFRKLVERNRTRRKFDENRPIRADELVELVDLVRFMPSGRNMQPLKYIVTADPEQCARVFPLLGWAGYLKDWRGPAEGERPTGYIVMLLDRDVADSPGCDHGIACQTLMLGAVDKGYGGCIIATVNRPRLAEIFDLPDRYEILMVLALGVPAQEVVVEPLPSDGSIKYWTGEDGKHHVPKRGLDELLVGRFPEK
ncbi:nitroreductase family protein [Pseudodesulfovibrio thermohalotolerans]|uniref:nitroreductase family protein n=1 Tax=Pseudodesulfovibrio thermohalotolerans TaxID=2880651 RepID=UPI002442B818|nr:nitroreductase family protein [Pseudodesulfovibrio thermohalotolerans]WFS64102.1 nitroreductase family protein [Pseudodesulfovibrio thermohalotolerans]